MINQIRIPQTLFGAKLNTIASESAVSIDRNLRSARKELFMSKIPAMHENRFQVGAVKNALFFSNDINSIWPELRDEFHNRMGTGDNAFMRAIIYCELKKSGLR